MEVLFEGADEDIYKPLNSDEIDSEFFDMINEKIPEKFAFLFVGQWGKGGFGEDRKDIGNLIKVFYESFANKSKRPALVLKTNGAAYSIMDREDCLSKIKNIKSQFPADWKLPNVYLLHGSFSDEEINYLYNHPKMKAMVSLTHGEGFGRPLLEASMTGLPIVASGWSGQMDFLDEEYSMLLNGEMKDVPKSQHWEHIIIPESKWFDVNKEQAYKSLNFCFKEQQIIKSKGKQLMDINREKFTFNKMVEKLDDIMEKYLKDAPQQVGLKLPKLKKVGNSEPPKIKLPTLKKVGKD
tara:strand:- start:299 stop:1183 length:885 start_codon:yes stop_codon:yes gene_type:complete